MSDDGGDGDNDADFDCPLSLVSIIYVYYSVVLSDSILHYFVKKNKNILTNAKGGGPRPVRLFQIARAFFIPVSSANRKVHSPGHFLLRSQNVVSDVVEGRRRYVSDDARLRGTERDHAQRRDRQSIDGANLLGRTLRRLLLLRRSCSLGRNRRCAPQQGRCRWRDYTGSTCGEESARRSFSLSITPASSLLELLPIIIRCNLHDVICCKISICGNNERVCEPVAVGEE